MESKTPQTTAPTSSTPAAANDRASSLASSVADPANLNAVGSVEVKSVPEAETATSVTPVTIVDEPPPMPAMKPVLKPVSGGVLNGIALKLPAPLYPDSAKRLRVSGVVTVQVVVDETGKVIVAEATNGPNLLRETAIQAALRARFSPTKLSGQPVKVTGTINYRFALAQ
jgi:TonB family protein